MKMKPFNPYPLMKEIENSVERSCDTCANTIMCWAEGKPMDQVCNEWEIDFMTFQDKWEELKETSPNGKLV